MGEQGQVVLGISRFGGFDAARRHRWARRNERKKNKDDDEEEEAEKQKERKKGRKEEKKIGKEENVFISHWVRFNVRENERKKMHKQRTRSFDRRAMNNIDADRH